MNFSEYREKVMSRAEFPPEMDFKRAFLWLDFSNLPMGLVSFGDTDLEIIKIPKRVKNEYGRMVPIIVFAPMVFEGNEKVTDIILSPFIELIPKGAFAGCTNLRNIFIPKKVKEIGEAAFDGCTKLENIYYEGTPEEWQKVKIPSSNHEIEFGPLVEGTPVQSIAAERDVHIPGNEAVFAANIHYRCIGDN